MNIVVADVRNYLHRLMDDDFTVNSNSNDEKAERMSESRSKRVYWKTFLPLLLSVYSSRGKNSRLPSFPSS